MSATRDWGSRLRPRRSREQHAAAPASRSRSRRHGNGLATVGRAAVVGEAIRTGSWALVSDLDYAAWLNAYKMDEIARSPLTIAEADRIIESGYTAHPRGEEAMSLLVADWTAGNDRAKDAA